MNDEKLEQMFAMVSEIHAAMKRRQQQPASSTTHTTRSARPTRGAVVDAFTKPAATAKHDPSDPVVKIIPKGWKGDDLRGKRYSECPPAFLGMMSHMLDSFASKNEDDPERQKYAKWDRENAECARKWRAKLEGKPDLFDQGETADQLADAGAF